MRHVTKRALSIFWFTVRGERCISSPIAVIQLEMLHFGLVAKAALLSTRDRGLRAGSGGYPAPRAVASHMRVRSAFM